MFDISFGELAIIFVVALLVLGPERLPKVARTIGKIVGQIQQHASHLKQELAREGELAELRKIHEETTRNLQEVGQQLIAPLHQAEQQLSEAAQTYTNEISQATALSTVETETKIENEEDKKDLPAAELAIKPNAMPAQEVLEVNKASEVKEDIQPAAISTTKTTVQTADADGQLDLFATPTANEKQA